ncbi:unnamed protein product [Citrullus colocynthis]|uniref:Uncharacterized protein n=1 Tax=Citrullus colocynthis TaxID=252529 RepID=A0ABP0ZCY1_9ROSI
MFEFFHLYLLNSKKKLDYLLILFILREKFLSTESVIVRKLKGRRRRKERHAEAMGYLFAWLFNLFLLIFLIAILGYQIICLVDLESDYINLFDSTSRMNRVIMLEFIAQAVFSFVHLPAPHWFMFFVSLPCLFFNVRL